MAKQFKTELHAHTAEVSPCADLCGADVVERFIASGYDSVVITNHYCDYVIDRAGDTWEEKIEHYLSGWRAAKDAAKGRINVILGCELRFTENLNDYLIFGMTEDFMRTHPELHKMTLKSFSALARENGILVVQAHPFRYRMTVMPPEYLDGIEVFNGHIGHDSRNFAANAWANRYGLIRTSGGDFHHPHQPSDVAGILTDKPVTTMEQLTSILKSGDYSLICAGPVAERDGIEPPERKAYASPSV